jgi:glycosyltransferase involved in cell wall biosynthesis
MTRLSIITPTIGRASLRTMLSGLLPQLESTDEVFVIGDGDQPKAREIVKELASPLIQYWEIPLIRNFGNPQRNEAIKVAKGDYLCFVDDDDRVHPNYASVIKDLAGKNPGRPLMVRMKAFCGILWRDKNPSFGNMSGQMFVPPNVPDRLGKWSGKYEADFDFIWSTLNKYPDRERSIVWGEEVIVSQGWAGPTGAGGIVK